MRADRVYRSRVDRWLAIVVIAAAFAPIIASLWLFWAGGDGAWLLLIWGSLVTAGIASISVPLRYTLREDELHIRSGWLQWRIRYSDLRSVRPSFSWLISPAWSLRRVRLETPDFVILVSPDDRESFINELAARCPHLVRDGVGLEARPRSR